MTWLPLSGITEVPSSELPPDIPGLGDYDPAPRSNGRMIFREDHSEWPLPEDVREAWRHWLRRHSIDPDHVSAHGPIEVDTDARTIRFVAYDLDEDGCRHAAPDGKTAAQSTRIMQLDTPLAPFPEVLERRLTTRQCPATSP